MDLSDESSEEEDEPVAAAPAPTPNTPRLSPPRSQPSSPKRPCRGRKQMAAGVEKAEELVAAVAAAEAVAVKQEVAGIPMMQPPLWGWRSSKRQRGLGMPTASVGRAAPPAARSQTNMRARARACAQRASASAGYQQR